MDVHLYGPEAVLANFAIKVAYFLNQDFVNILNAKVSQT